MQKTKLLVIATAALLAGCTHETAIPLGNDRMEIDTSVAGVYGRAGAMRIAMHKAAVSTVQMGYDKFIVENTNGWNETTEGGASFANVNGSANGQSASVAGQGGSSWGTQRHPEAKIIIHMFHDGEKGSAKAVDAHKLLEMDN